MDKKLPLQNLPSSLIDQPSILSKNWKGYYRKIDPTVLPLNTLTFPSVNCSIPNFDKIVPDKGKKLLGQEFTENVPIIGNKEKFVNLGGSEMEVRVYNSVATPAKRDVIEVLYNGSWVQITENINNLPLGVHRYSFDDWWDSNTDLSQSKNVPRLIWVNGCEDGSQKGSVFSWTGGIVPIDSLTGTTLTIANNVPWQSLGFTEDINGDAFIVVNGVSYQITDPNDLNTDTITVTSTAGITVGDIAVSKIEEDEVPIAFDFCRETKGYMYYGNWKQRKLYQSNAFNRPATQVISNSNAIQDDMSISTGSSYTGTGSHVYKIKIDSIDPAENTPLFLSNGGIEGGSFIDATGYSATGLNIYKVLTICDLLITFTAGAGTYTNSELAVGQTSGAVVRIVVGGSLAGGALYAQTVSGFPVAGEILLGQTSGTGRTILGGGVQQQSAAYVYKNNVLITGLAGAIDDAIQFALTGPQTLVDGLVFQLNSTGTNTAGDYWQLTINSGSPDTFTVQFDDDAPGAPTDITGANQSIGDGLSIIFINTTGHSVGDYWTIQVDQLINRAWVDFYYTLPVRKPGEGYIFTLPSNFWTMDTQEQQLYVNTAYGQWIRIATQLSGDLRSESIEVSPLKQSGSNKVIDPWLTGHLENDLVYVTIDKNLDSIGRKELLELPQATNISDPVKLDFLESTFVGGGIKYIGKKLYVVSPVESITHCYDTLMKYWQPPKRFVEMGIPSIVGNELIVHSNIRNQTFTMFADVTDNGSAYQVIIRTPYTAVNNRWKSKFSSMSFVEGYYDGNPLLKHTVYLEPSGCGGIYSHNIEPIVCIAPDRSPLGAGPFGSHALGSDTGTPNSYFQEIYKSYSPILGYYFLAMEIECTSKNHTWSILSLGMNAIYSNNGNNPLVNKSTKVL